MAKGKIGVTTENIFPVIKKFLYSDHEIFLREIVSNAIDATQKIKTLTSCGEFKGELGELTVSVKINKEAGTLTISDHGLGMDADDIEKYINQIAFSGAEEFLNKYKENAGSIIGHFGLGFYSAFMVSEKVEINSLSYKDGAKAVRWSCDGSPEYTMEDSDKSERGTDIILYIDNDSKQFLEEQKIEELLKKYCRFLPTPVIFGKQKEWKDGKYIDTETDNIINSIEPLWSKKPTELTDDDYLKFYRELIPGGEDPMFWIHLNVDYPFTLTGILYFPKIKTDFDPTRNRIQLYCNQVYVTDQVEGVVPEFMTLMQGVIDSPDIPLNVSRSYLQADSQVKKISSYISKKVAERLSKMFKDNRNEYEKKWDDIKIFIEYGMLTDEKFCDSAMNFCLVKDIDENHYTLEQYKDLVKTVQTDKNGNLVYLYATDKNNQYSFIEAAKDKGYSTLLMDGRLDNHFISLLERKNEKTRLVRVDSDIIDRLIEKDDKKSIDLNALQIDIVTTLFKSQIHKIDNAEFMVQLEATGETYAPATITQNEFMRRMKDMAQMQPSMNFYGNMPDNYNMIVNVEHPIVKKIITDAIDKLKNDIEPLRNDIDKLNDCISKLRKSDDNASNTKQNAEEIEQNEKKIEGLRQQETIIINNYTEHRDSIKQIIDLALLQTGLLKGENLDQFIRRSTALL